MKLSTHKLNQGPTHITSLLLSSL